MDTYKACTYCRQPADHPHQPWCLQVAKWAFEVPPEAPPAAISSEDSTTIDPAAEKELRASADNLLAWKHHLQKLQSLCGMPDSVFWPTVQMAAMSHTNGRLAIITQLLTKSLSASRDSDPQPAPSSLPSTAQAASDADTPDESLRQYNSDEPSALARALMIRMTELQDQILANKKVEQINTVSLAQRLTALEERFSPAPRPTSDMMPTVDFITPSEPRMAGSATSSSASIRSTSKPSKPRKRTKAGSVSSSAKRKPGKRGGISSLQLVRRSVAMQGRSSRKEV